jgi:hypothetical protein
MKPKFDHRVKRPGGKMYDMSGETDLRSKFAAIRREQAAAARKHETHMAETSAKVKPMVRKKA